VTQEKFFTLLEHEMRKIEQFTNQQVQQIRKVLNEVERTVTFSTLAGKQIETESLQKEVEHAGDDFLKY
jgi:hypothetical protein